MSANEEPKPEAEEPPDELLPEERGGWLQWLIFIEITVLCALAAYIQITGIKQLPLP